MGEKFLCLRCGDDQFTGVGYVGGAVFRARCWHCGHLHLWTAKGVTAKAREHGNMTLYVERAA